CRSIVLADGMDLCAARPDCQSPDGPGAQLAFCLFMESLGKPCGNPGFPGREPPDASACLLAGRRAGGLCPPAISERSKIVGGQPFAPSRSSAARSFRC